MSSKIDDRIVNMKFNNAQFEKGVADTSRSLENLKKGLNLSGAAKGLQDIAVAGKNMALDGLANSVQTIASKFNALTVIGVTALTNIATKAIDAGLALGRSLTIQPITDGLAEYELKMGSIQTILANTARYGTGLNEVTASLDELNKYADKTIYNFGDMTKNIGLFTNAGINVQDATSMIKGFSNEAAASGTSAAGAAGAAYQLSQALSAGTIRLMDWRSLTNVGMGNKNMQLGLIEIADAMGTLEANTISAEEVQADFNGSLEKNWLSADVMSAYLKIMAGDMDVASQAALGLSDAQIQAFAKQAATAEEAATKVRTWTQLVGTMQEAVGSGWSETFDILIGDFNEATDLWTNVNNALGPIIDGMSDARNNLLQAWKEGGGRDSAINAVANAWKAASSIISTVKDAFQEIFPPLTADTLINITKGIENFTKALQPGETALGKIFTIAKGLFAALDIGWMIVKQVAGVFGRLFSSATEGASGLLDFGESIGLWLIKARDALKTGDGLATAFKWLGDQLLKPIELLKQLGKATMDFIDVDSWSDAWNKVANAIKRVAEFLSPVAQWVGEAFRNIKAAVTGFFQTMDFNVLVGLLNVGALSAVAIGIKKVVDLIKDGISFKDGTGLIDSIKGIFGAVTDTFGAMQEKLKAETLQKIAIAIGIMTAAVVALSFVDTGKMFIALGAMTVMFGQLSAMMMLMDKVVTGPGAAKMPLLAAGMVGMATAMVIFSGAVAIMSSLSWEELAKGMSGFAVGMGLMIGAMALIGKMPVKMTLAGGAMTIMATGMVILASALKIMSTMSWEDIAQSMATLAGSLGLLTAASQGMSRGIAGAAAMVVIASAMVILSAALKVMASMSWEEIAKSLVTLAGSLTILTVALALMQGSILGAAAMVTVSVGLIALAGALQIMGTMSWEEIGKALVVMAGSLVILAGAMALMGLPPVLLGSVGLLAAAAAMMALAPSLAILGTMSWDAIGRGLTMLAGALVIIAAGGILLLPAIPGLMALGAAAALIGVGALAAGAGMMMMSTALAALAGAAEVGAEAIKIAVLALIDLIPEAMSAFAQGIIDFAKVIANGGAEFTAAMTTLLQSLITSINTLGPQIIDTLFNLVMALVQQFSDNVPKFVDAGMRMIVGILEGIGNNIGRVIDAATKIITNFLDGIARNIPAIIQSGFDLIIDFIDGVTNAIDSNAERLGAAGGRMAAAIIRGMVNGIGAGIGEIISAAQDMASSALQAAKDFLGIHSPSREFEAIGKFVNQGFVKGITGSSGEVKAVYDQMNELLKSAVKGAGESIDRARKNIERLTDARNEDLLSIRKTEEEISKRQKEKKDVSDLTERLRKLTKSRDANNKAILEEQKNIAEAEAERQRARNGLNAMNTSIKAQRNELVKLADAHEVLSNKVDLAQTSLDDAKQKLNDHVQNTKSQYNQLGSIDINTGYDQYVLDLQTQIRKTYELDAKLQELRNAGLNDKMYKDLLSKGVDVLPFLDQVLKRGDSGVAELNRLSSQLDKTAGMLGKNTGKELYQAGVDAAKGLLEGLQSQKKALEKQMDDLAKAMVAAIKKSLAVDAPVNELVKTGKDTGKSVIKGVFESLPAVKSAANKASTNITTAVDKGLKNTKTDGKKPIEVEPVIRPVVDLKNAKKDIASVDNKFLKAPIDVKLQSTKVQTIASTPKLDPNATFESRPATPPREVNFTQNIIAPKQPSPAELYRQTNNQLSQAKKELSIPDA